MLKSLRIWSWGSSLILALFDCILSPRLNWMNLGKDTALRESNLNCQFPAKKFQSYTQASLSLILMTPHTTTTTNILVPKAFQKYSTCISSHEKIFSGKKLPLGRGGGAYTYCKYDPYNKQLFIDKFYRFDEFHWLKLFMALMVLQISSCALLSKAVIGASPWSPALSTDYLSAQYLSLIPILSNSLPFP